MIAGLLLAGGAARRFGSNKLVEPLAGRAVVRWSAEALAFGVDELFVVVPDEALEIREALAELAVRFVTNRDASDGLSSSIRAGITALPADAEAVVIALGDQPLLDRTVVARLIARWRDGGVSAVAASYDDGRGHPVLFGSALYSALHTLDGDRGARALLDALGTEVATVAVEGRQPTDVDTRDALESIRAVIADLRRETL